MFTTAGGLPQRVGSEQALLDAPEQALAFLEEPGRVVERFVADVLKYHPATWVDQEGAVHDLRREEIERSPLAKDLLLRVAEHRVGELLRVGSVPMARISSPASR